MENESSVFTQMKKLQLFHKFNDLNNKYLVMIIYYLDAPSVDKEAINLES